jgi:hypothetical protein
MAKKQRTPKALPPHWLDEDIEGQKSLLSIVNAIGKSRRFRRLVAQGLKEANKPHPALAPTFAQFVRVKLLEGLNDPDLPAKSNLEIMLEAEEIVQRKWPTAVLFAAGGQPSMGQANTARDIDIWDFQFREILTDLNIQISYANGNFGKPKLTPPFLGAEIQRLPHDHDLSEAVSALRAAGYTDAFSQVGLARPVVFPPVDEALYMFKLPGGVWVFIGAETLLLKTTKTLQRAAKDVKMSRKKK